MTEREIIIDGSEGEGGGQVIRTSLSLSAITGKPLRIENVRGKRKKPGLFRQHLTALRAAAEICDAEVSGDSLKSSEFSFCPGQIKAGDYDFAIGSAGATTLVAQTTLPILSFADGPSTVTISGGTHNIWAPTFDYLDQAFLPQFRKMGGRAKAEIEAYGFNPAGGGRIRLDIDPVTTPERLELNSRGDKRAEQVTALVANLKDSIGKREVKTLLRGLNLHPEQGEVISVESAGPGNCVTLALPFEHVTELIIGIGQHGVRAESLAKHMVKEAQGFLKTEAAVGPHLADQLILPMALLAGGEFTTNEITQHTRTNIEIIQRFLDVEITLEQTDRKCWRITVIPTNRP